MGYLTQPQYKNARSRNNLESKTSGKISYVVLAVLVAGLIVVFSLYRSVFKPHSSENSEIHFNVEFGDGRDVIAKKLEELDLISSKSTFIWYLKFTGKGGNIKAGNHILNKNLSISEIVKILEDLPDDQSIWVTIPEGIRYDEIADIIDAKFKEKNSTGFNKERFLEICANPYKFKTDPSITQSLDKVYKYLPEGKSIEGFLYPDTYNFAIDATENDVIKTLTKTFFDKLGPDKVIETIENESEYSVYETLIIASMVEREANGVEEAKMIADIIDRRIEQNYLLGIDATSLYYLKDWRAQLTYKELKDDNPYNTRVNLGLPPTPICNPGVATINAVVNPTVNEYMFYLHSASGKIYYAKTNAEHEANRQKP